MVSVATLHYEVEMELNRIHTSLKKDVSSVDIDAYLNRAKHIILDRYVEIAEKNKKVNRYLGFLEKPSTNLTVIESNSEYNVYELPTDFYSYLRVSSKACLDEECITPQPMNTLDYTQRDDLNENLKDPFRKPNWNWRRVLYNFMNKGLQMFHNSQYDLKEVKIDYIKWLPDVAYVSVCDGEKYLASDGVTVITEDANLNVPETNILWRHIVQIAVYYIRKDLDENFKGEIESYLFDQNIGVS